MDTSVDTVSTSGRICGSVISKTVFKSSAELAAVQDEWDRFIEDSGSDIYFTVDWLQIWWAHYGGERDLRCYLLRRGGRLIAALPFCIGPLRIGPVSVRLARFAGAESTITVLHPAIERGFEREAMDVVCRRLLVEERCDAVSLSPLSGLSPVGNAVETMCHPRSAYYLAHDDSTGHHTTIDLPDSFQEYLSTLSRQARSNYRRHSRQLAERYALSHLAVTIDGAGAGYDKFVALHGAQWQAVGRLGHFGDWPGSEAFYRELVARLAGKGQVRLYQMYVDGEIISMQFGFLLADRYYWRLPARRPIATDEKLGVGRVGLVKMLEALIDDQCRTVEAGPGHYEYKLRHGGVEHSLRRQVITWRTYHSRLKTVVLVAWSQLIHLLYYRFWFLKLTRLLRLPPRPLRHLWIRTRL